MYLIINKSCFDCINFEKIEDYRYKQIFGNEVGVCKLDRILIKEPKNCHCHSFERCKNEEDANTLSANL